MEIKCKNTDNRTMIINEIKERLNGSAEKGFSYSAENMGEYVLINFKPHGKDK